MRVFITGASGFVGSAVLKELVTAGHQVIALARSENAAQAIGAGGAQILFGDLENLAALKQGAEAADAVIHCGFIHDWSNFPRSCAIDQQAIRTLGEVLASSGRPLIATTGTGLMAKGVLAEENGALDQNPMFALRAKAEAIISELASRDVSAMVMRLPPSVHGDGDHGFVPYLVQLAREKGVAAYIGEGQNRWPAVHRLDAARLYRLAIENPLSDGRLHAIHDGGVPTRDIADTIGKGLGVPVKSVSAEQAAEHFGWMAPFFGFDNPATGEATREHFQWQPQQRGLLEDIAHGTYLKAV